MTSLQKSAFTTCLLVITCHGFAADPAPAPAPAKPAAPAKAAAPAAAAAPAPILEKITPAGPGGSYSLDQFGNVKSNEGTFAAFQAAEQYLNTIGGGIIYVPTETAGNWTPFSIHQHSIRIPMAPAPCTTWKQSAGITVVDARGSRPTIYPPEMNGITIKRVLDLPKGESLPHWDYFPMINMQNTVAFGSTSYLDWVQEDAEGGPDTKIYVATVRGLFPGMFINFLGHKSNRLWIKSLGYDKDKKMWYFVADTTVPINKGAIVQNKNHVNLVKMETRSHNENQTFDLVLWRHNYSQGDNYLIDARFKYTGDIHSTGGDENGVIFGAFVEGHTKAFRGVVETWDPVSGEMKFTNGGSQDTLGSGRPIININPKKAITQGSVWIVRPAQWTEDSSKDLDNPVFQGKTYPTVVVPNRLGIKGLHVGGLIRFTKDAPITPDVVGRYFALDEPTELTKPDTGDPSVHRWYLIDSVTVNPDGTKDLQIIRHWWGAKAANAPTLYNPENYSYDGHERPLKYVIAPGVNAFDVSDALPGVGGKNVLRLAPPPFAGTEFDFAKGDTIEQAIGPDPFHPQTLRSWTWDKVPGIFPATYLDMRNLGDVQRHSVMTVRGGTGTSIEKDLEKSYMHCTPYEYMIEFLACSNSAIRFGADVRDAAIDFLQPNNRAQPIRWSYAYNPDNNSRKNASLTVSPADGTFKLDGNGAAIPGGVSQIGGISGTETKANNLRGLNVAVKAGSKSVTVKFTKPEADENYGVFVEASFINHHAVTSRSADGFTVEFETAPSKDARIDWMLVR